MGLAFGEELEAKEVSFILPSQKFQESLTSSCHESLSDPRTPPPDEAAALLPLSQGPCQHLLQMASNPAVLRRPMTSEFIPPHSPFPCQKEKIGPQQIDAVPGKQLLPICCEQAGERPGKES